jgi:hypothetical protein
MTTKWGADTEGESYLGIHTVHSRQT